MDLYQNVEQKVEELARVHDKSGKLNELIKQEEIQTIDTYVIIYWFYSLGKLITIFELLTEKGLPDLLREYLLQLLLKRAEMKSKDSKIKDTVKKSKELIKDVILKLNNQEIPVFSKNVFEKLMISAVNYFPNYFKTSVIKRIRNNIYNYIKIEKLKDG